MTFPYIKIVFPELPEFLMYFGEDGMKTNSTPEWAQMKHMSCPGDIKHDPIVKYCRLGVEFELLINYFATIDSIIVGEITFQQNQKAKISISDDAQHIFFNSVWFILLHSNCYVFKHNQWLRKHYLPPTNREEMFYSLFSTFVMEELYLSPESQPNLAKFKSQLELLRDVLNNLLQRIKQGLKMKGDSVLNGFIIIDSLITQLELDFEKTHEILKEKILQGGLPQRNSL